MAEPEPYKRTEQDARNEYVKDLRDVIQCVADVHVYPVRHPEQSDLWLLTTAGGDAGKLVLKLKNGKKLLFEVDQHVRIRKDEEGFRVTTVKYIYVLWRDNDIELFGWHYHPEDNPPDNVVFPHVQLYDKQTEADRKCGCEVHPLHGHHLPAGRVALEDVVEFLINELGVVPCKENWQQVLETTRKRFEALKTWGSAPKPT